MVASGKPQCLHLVVARMAERMTAEDDGVESGLPGSDIEERRCSAARVGQDVVVVKRTVSRIPLLFVIGVWLAFRNVALSHSFRDWS